MNQNNPRLGILLMIATTFIFALQDGLSRYLAGEYNTIMIIMLRYWFFAAFVITLSTMRKGGIRRVARTQQPMLQILRGVLLVGEICVAVVAFVKLGLVESHAILTSYPLLVAALSGPILGERVGWRRWAALGGDWYRVYWRAGYPAPGHRGFFTCCLYSTGRILDVRRIRFVNPLRGAQR